MIKGRVSIVLLMAGLVGLLVMGCAGPTTPPLPTPMPRAGESTPAIPKSPAKAERISMTASSRGAHDMAIYVGLHKGLFKEEGLDVEMRIMKAPIAAAALMAGEVDYTSASTFQLSTQGGPVRTIMIIRGKPAWWVMTKPEIRTVQDLKGKNIGVGSMGTINQFSIMKVLQLKGIDPTKEVRIISLGGDPATRFGALKAGTVDALLEVAPQSYIIQKSGFPLLLKVREGVPEAVVGSLSATIKKIRDNPDQVKRVIRATLKSMIYAREHKEETVDILLNELKELSVDRETMTAAYEDTVDTLTKNGEVSDQGVVVEIAMMREFGEKVTVPAASQLVDYSLLREVQKELGLTK